MAVGGSKREIPSGGEFTKKVGFFEATVAAINPSAEEFKSQLDIELKEDSKATEYLSTDKDGTSKLRVDVWLKDVKSEEKLKLTFWLEDNKKFNKDKTKKQYVNSVGITTWASSEEDLPQWFVKNRDYRVAYVGEEDFVGFLRIWLGGLDFMDDSTELMLDWKSLMRGNLKEWKEQIDGEWCQTVGALATIKTVEKEDGPVSYQNVYNKAFFPGYNIKNMRNMDYNNPEVVRSLSFKKFKELKMHERFVVNVVGEYGCKDYYTFKELHDYDPSNNVAASDKVYSTDDADY
jgi:hypothetical protein